MVDLRVCLTVALLVGATACEKPAPKAAAPKAAPVAKSKAERYLPLLDAVVYAYDTEAQPTGERGMLVLEVRRPRRDVGELVVAGRTRRIEIDETGLRHATGGWLLKEPLTLGSRYQGDFGTVEVKDVDKSVTVTAGSFTHCIETVESSNSSEYTKQTTTVFCPDVGIVTRVTEAESDEGAGTEILRLRSYGPRVTL